MPFRYQVALYTGYQVLARSVRWCGFETGMSHKNDKVCLPGVVFFFSQIFLSLSSDLIYEMGSNALNNLVRP